MINTTWQRACLCLGLLWPLQHAAAIPITIDTTWLDANGKMSLTTDARQTLAVTGIDMTVGGKASSLGDGVFNLPISKVTTDIHLLPPSLEMRSAQVKGSSLEFHNTLTQSRMSLADLSMDFDTHKVLGTMISAAGSTRVEMFTFEELSPLKFSFKGGISITTSLGNLHFTDEGARRFVDALGVPSFLAPVLLQVNFGTIDARVVPWFRSSVSAVPEPTAVALLSIGLAWLTWRARSGRGFAGEGARG